LAGLVHWERDTGVPPPPRDGQEVVNWGRWVLWQRLAVVRGGKSLFVKVHLPRPVIKLMPGLTSPPQELFRPYGRRFHSIANALVDFSKSGIKWQA
jgi:hypothetical protein